MIPLARVATGHRRLQAVTLCESDQGYLLEEVARAFAIEPERLLRLCLERRWFVTIRRYGVFVTPWVIERLLAESNPLDAYRVESKRKVPRIQ